MTGESHTPTDDSHNAVLLIEDEAPTRHGLRAECLSRGFVVDTAAGASEAHRLLSARAYAAVVLDILLLHDEGEDSRSGVSRAPSRWKGVEVLQCIRNGSFATSGTAANVPVFVLTCVLDADMRRELDALSVQEFFSKPEDLAYVAERIKLFLKRSCEA